MLLYLYQQPLTSTYVAMWSFGLGHLAADLTIPHFASLQRIARAFVSNFLDEDNTLHDDDAVMPLPDVTFLSATLRSIDVNVWSRDSAVNLAVPQGLSIQFNDHVSRGCLTRIEATAPSIQARGLVHSQADQWSEVTSCDLSLSITATTTSTDWELRQLTQKHFLAAQDLPTARCSFLYEEESVTAAQCESNTSTARDGALALNASSPMQSIVASDRCSTYLLMLSMVSLASSWTRHQVNPGQWRDASIKCLLGPTKRRVSETPTVHLHGVDHIHGRLRLLDTFLWLFASGISPDSKWRPHDQSNQCLPAYSQYSYSPVCMSRRSYSRTMLILARATYRKNKGEPVGTRKAFQLPMHTLLVTNLSASRAFTLRWSALYDLCARPKPSRWPKMWWLLWNRSVHRGRYP